MARPRSRPPRRQGLVPLYAWCLGGAFLAVTVKTAIVSGSFDDLRLHHVRFLHEASRFGALHLLMWSDAVLKTLEGAEPKFPQEEREYLLRSIRCVSRLTVVSHLDDREVLPSIPATTRGAWIVEQRYDSTKKRDVARRHGLEYHVLAPEDLRGLPDWGEEGYRGSPSLKKVVVTGCYDWLHSGHVRFFEEASHFGELYVIVGSDRNLRLLKGQGHPMFSQDERLYMVRAVRHVHRALVTSGSGWMDAQPEIAQIDPDIYVVNEDGDRPEKRDFCAAHGLRYVVLKRLPRQGLPARQSTDLRGS